MITKPAFRQFNIAFLRSLLMLNVGFPDMAGKNKVWIYDAPGDIYVFGREIAATLNPALNAWYVYLERTLGYTSSSGRQNYGRITSVYDVVQDYYNRVMGIE